MTKISYRLLGILQELAPNGTAQEKCAEIYRQMQSDGISETEIAAAMAGAIADGYRFGNWPWVPTRS